MTVGKPGKIIMQFTIPVLLGNLFQQLYAMADTVIVGQFVGVEALAAVGSVGTIMFLIGGFVIGMTTGFTVLTAQRYGAKDMKGMRDTVGSAYLLSILVTVILTAVSMLGMKPLLHLMNTPEDIFDDAYLYIMIICAGIAAQVMYNLFSSVLRAMGNSKTPLYFLTLSAVLNVVLDLLFIIQFNMGTAGAAYATIISQGVSGVLCLVYIIIKVPALKLERENWKLNGHLARIQMGLGFPMALQFSITAIGTMMVQASLNILGSVAVAAFTAASKIENLVGQTYWALGTTIMNFSAQNRGAGKVDRIRQGFRSATIIGIIYSVAMGVFLAIGGKYLAYMFVSDHVTELIDYVGIYLTCVGVFLIPLAIINIYRNGIQGLGYGLLPMMSGVAELIGRGIVAMIAAHYMSYLGVCMASPVAWVLAGGLLIVMYYWIMNHHLDKKKV